MKITVQDPLDVSDIISPKMRTGDEDDVHITCGLLNYLILADIEVFKKVRELNAMEKPSAREPYAIEYTASDFFQDFGWLLRGIRREACIVTDTVAQEGHSFSMEKRDNNFAAVDRVGFAERLDEDVGTDNRKIMVVSRRLYSHDSTVATAVRFIHWYMENRLDYGPLWGIKLLSTSDNSMSRISRPPAALR